MRDLAPELGRLLGHRGGRAQYLPRRRAGVVGRARDLRDVGRDGAGPGFRLEKLSMQFATSETSSSVGVLEAYERLILDAMRGDHTLFTTAEGIERLWEVSAALIDNPPPVRFYEPGSWGPKAIHQLIAPRAWRLPFERAWRGPGPVKSSTGPG